MKSTHALTKVTSLSDNDVFRVDIDPSSSEVTETPRGITASVIRSYIGIALTNTEILYGFTDDDINKLYPPGDPRRMGAVLDGVTDDSTAFYNTGRTAGVIYHDQSMGVARIASQVVFDSPIHMYGGGTIFPDLGSGGGKLLAFETDDVLVDGMTFDGLGATDTLSANMYMLFGGDGVTKHYRHVYRNNTIKNCFLSDELEQSSNLLVTHALYVDNVDQVAVRDNTFNTISGSGFFCRAMTGLVVDKNRFVDCQWYNCTLDSDVTQFAITNNYFNCQLETGVYWGGAVNLMSLHTAGRNSAGIVDNNYFTGKYSYGTVVRCLSITGLEVSNNVIENWDYGTWALVNDLSAIRVDTRGVSTAAQNGPCHDVTIRNNRMSNPDTIEDHRGIYCGNQFQSSRTPSTNIRVYDNEITSASTSLYFSEGIIFHGFAGGFEGVHVYGNDVTVYGQTGPTVGGALGFVASNSDGTVDRVHYGRNNLVGLGTPSGSEHVGVSVGAYTDNINQTERNYIDNFYYGVRTLTNSGPTMDGIDDNEYANIANTELLDGVVLSRYRRLLKASATYDPPSLGDEADTFTDVTVTGAALGDHVRASFSLDNQGIVFRGYVRVANSVRVYLKNVSGGTIDLGSGTLYVIVEKR